MSAEFEAMAVRLASELANISNVKVSEDTIRVTTHCMYPSNSLVRVALRFGRDSVVAYDDGETLGEATAAGIPLRHAERLLGPIVKTHGLEIDRGIIRSPRMPLSSAVIAVLLVANGAKEAAQWIYEHGRVKRDRDFRRLLSSFLKSEFDAMVAPTKIAGASTKEHKFQNVINFGDGHKLIVDPVAHEPQSINARVIANLDVKSMNDPRILQRIVYDDEEEWTAGDLNLLNVGATVVPFSKAPEVITRVATRSPIFLPQLLGGN